MGAFAKIMAYLGMDASGFNANIDGAVRRLRHFERSVTQIRRVSSFMLGVEVFDRLKGQLKELEEYGKRTGIKLVSDEDVRTIESASNAFKRLEMELTAAVAPAAAKTLLGLKSLWAGFSSGWNRNKLAEAIEDVDTLDEHIKTLTDSIAKLKEAQHKRETPTETQIGEGENKLRNLLRNHELIQAELTKQAWSEIELKKLNDELLQNQEDQLKVQAELVDLDKKRSQEVKEWAQFAKDARRADQQRVREENEAEDAKRENLASVEQVARARVRLAVPETTEEERTAERLERMTELQAKFDDADRNLRRLFDAGQAPDESEEVRNKRLSEAMTQKNRAALAIIQERSRVKKEDRDLAEAEGAKVDQEVKQRVQKRKRRKDILSEGEERKQEIAGGVGASGVRGIEMPGGLQSIGGYFAGADASRRAQADKAARVQEQIAEVDKQMLAELKRLNGED